MMVECCKACDKNIEVLFDGDWRYVIPMAMGGWLGTYLSVLMKEKT